MVVMRNMVPSVTEGPHGGCALAHVGHARGQRGRHERLDQRLHVRVKVQERIVAAEAQQHVEGAQLQEAKVAHLVQQQPLRQPQHLLRTKL